MRYLTRQEASLFQHIASGPDRLRALVSFLDALPAERLSLGFWFRDGRGCAIGLAAATDPWFQAQGLRLAEIDKPALCHPVYREKSDWESVTAFFELGVEQCRWLFAAAAYSTPVRLTPRSIAERIERQLATAGAATSSKNVADFVRISV